MVDFTVGEWNYRTARRLNAFEQLHVARKLAPMIAALAPEAMRRRETTDDDTTGFFSLMGPVIDGLAAMAEEDVNYVVHRCISVVQRQQGQGWAAIWNATAKRMMFEDIDAMELLQIAFQVIQENLASFMRAPSLHSQQPSQPTTERPANLSPFPTERISY